PKEMSERYPDALHTHRLRREIIATQLTNSMINRGGATLIVRIADQTGALPPAIAAAFAAVRNSYDLIELNSKIDALDNKISGKVQLDLYGAVQDLLLDRLVWFLRNVDLTQGLEKIIGHYREGIAQVATALDGALSKSATNARDARVAELVVAGVPDALARRIGALAVRKAAARIAPASRWPKWPRPISPPKHSSSSIASRVPCRISWCPTISTGWRSIARSIRSAMPNGGSRRRWSATGTPVRALWKNGFVRARLRSSASVWRSTKSPVRG